MTSSITVNAGGTLEGTGTVKGTSHDVTNSGTVQPGDSGGSLMLDHDYTQMSGAALNIQIGSIVAGGIFGNLKVPNLATLDAGSVLDVSLINNFTFGLGTSGMYDILDFKTLAAGAGFTSLEFEGIPCSTGWREKMVVRRWQSDCLRDHQ